MQSHVMVGGAAEEHAPTTAGDPWAASPSETSGHPDPGELRSAAPLASNRTVTARALALLDAFSPDARQLSLSEIARRSRTPLSTAHRLVRELENWRALERIPDGRYVIGRRLWELGMLSPLESRLRSVSMPFLQELQEATRHSVHLAVRDGLDVLYVEIFAGGRNTHQVIRAGGRLPLHATSAGKALLAMEGAAFRAHYLSRPLQRFTAYTLTEPGRLARELQVAREQGWARTVEELTTGSCSAAVPFLTPEGSLAAVGVVVPAARADLHRLVPMLRTAAQGITTRLTQQYHASGSGNSGTRGRRGRQTRKPAAGTASGVPAMPSARDHTVRAGRPEDGRPVVLPSRAIPSTRRP